MSVENTAETMNGWHVAAWSKSPQREGTVPSGVILFERESFPFPDRPYGTANYAIHPNEVYSFYSGHYDLTEDEAIEDFAKRVAAEGLAKVVVP